MITSTIPSDPGGLVSLVYVSTAPHKLANAELEAILADSRRNNARDGITGMLLYMDGNFIQAIEGPEPAIDDLLARLRRDPRHSDLVVMTRYPIVERQFPEWSMGFQWVTDTAPQALAKALSNLKDPIWTPELPPAESVAHKLLEGFRQSNRV